MIPDVIGYPLLEGLAILEDRGFLVHIKMVSPPQGDLIGEEKIARMIEVKEKVLELVVVKVPIPSYSIGDNLGE